MSWSCRLRAQSKRLQVPAGLVRSAVLSKTRAAIQCRLVKRGMSEPSILRDLGVCKTVGFELSGSDSTELRITGIDMYREHVLCMYQVRKYNPRSSTTEETCHEYEIPRQRR